MQYEVFAARYGTRTTTKSDVFLNYHLYGEPDTSIEMDYFFWVLRADGRSIAVDTGFSQDGGAKRARTSFGDPRALMGHLGLSPATTHQVIVTHAHYDHIGGLPLFPNAEVVISQKEFDFWTGPLAGRAQFAHSTEATEIAHLVELRDADRLTFVGASHTVAPGVEVIEVGGHTPGQMIVLIQTASGQVVLASDSLHYYEEVERDRPFSSVADLAAMYRAFDMLGELADESGTQVVAGHDPAVLDRFAREADEQNLIRIA